MRGSRYELSTAGFDSDFQGVGSDPSGGGYNVGIRIRPTRGDSPRTRYLYLLSISRFNANQKARLVGLRQLVTIAQQLPEDAEDSNSALYTLELEVKSPFWHFSDGNIVWYIQRVPPGRIRTANINNSQDSNFGYSTTPALLFQAPPGATGVGYAPPNGGRPPGTPLMPDLSGFHDLRFNWRSDNSENQSLDAEIQGPCDIALFASVQQTDPEERTTLTLPDGVLASDLPPEDKFVLNFPEAIYWRIAGSLVFEEEQYYPEAKTIYENDHDVILPCPTRGLNRRDFGKTNRGSRKRR